mmetsp:Transcript_17486/g.24977  ORF Transcript_17486/g.24977 Transcript_17486/m.24977 type:complete len:114 (-) Transcript_17486:13-354(-)
MIEEFFELMIFDLAGEDHVGEFFVGLGLEVGFGERGFFEGGGDGADWCAFCWGVYRLAFARGASFTTLKILTPLLHPPQKNHPAGSRTKMAYSENFKLCRRVIVSSIGWMFRE